MPPETLSVLFGIVSALMWGGGDFCGGQATRRASILPVLLLTVASGLALLVLLAVVFAEPLPSAAQLGWSVAAGLAGMVGLAALYQGLAIGSAAVVAPTSALLSAALPVLVSALATGLPGVAQLAGFGIGLIAIWLVAGGEGARGQAGRGLAVLAGIGFGSFFILIHQASAETTFWPTAAARTSAMLVVLVFLAVVARRDRLRAVPEQESRWAFVGWRAPALWLALLAGVLDAAGNAFFALAAQAGRLDIASVLASLYPASTVLLGRLFLAERITRLQSLGLIAALVAIVLVAS